jgi:hypothetical protein
VARTAHLATALCRQCGTSAHRDAVSPAAMYYLCSICMMEDVPQNRPPATTPTGSPWKCVFAYGKSSTSNTVRQDIAVSDFWPAGEVRAPTVESGGEAASPTGAQAPMA